MKSSKIIKTVIICVMSLGFALMFDHVLLGQNFHEIAGLIVLALFLIHFFLYWKWVVKTTKNIFNKKMTAKSRIGCLIDLLLLICVLVIGLSGILTSKVLFSGIAQQGGPWKSLHSSVACIALILAGLHLGLHWSTIKIKLQKLFKSKTAFRIAAIILVVVIIGGAVYGFINTKFTRNITSISTVFSGDTGGPGGGEGGPGGPEGGPGGPPPEGGPPPLEISVGSVVGELYGNLGILCAFSVVSALLVTAAQKGKKDKEVPAEE